MNLEELKEIWERFIRSGELDRKIQPAVAQSWKQCLEDGLSPMAGRGKRADSRSFEGVLSNSRELINIARPVMLQIYETIRKSHFLVALTDGTGYVLDIIGDRTIMEQGQKMHFVKGALWSNQQVGSNAVGIALETGTPIQMRGPEHYCLVHHDWTCSAAPIHGQNGGIIGCLDLSGAAEDAYSHTLALAASAANCIEMIMASRAWAAPLRTVLSGISGALMLDGQMHPVWVNRAAELMLDMTAQQLARTDFQKLLPEADWERIQTWDRSEITNLASTQLRLNKQSLVCGVSLFPVWESGERRIAVILERRKQADQGGGKYGKNSAEYTFESICARDPLMLRTVALAEKYAQYDGTVLIEGESGVGKELFAQAIHSASRRADGPFVVVNCASLPRNLIESELFGYVKGAFPGGLKEGNPGKFELANHGTLFLDEIGEMPLEYQGRLLRAVETSRVRRLGGTEELKLDIRIIAATGHDLREEAEQGRFRRDLYYRLDVLYLEIPPLRERPGDIVFCARKFLARLNERYPDQRKEMAGDFLTGLERYGWPGNVRELENGIERAFYASDSQILSRSDLTFLTGRPVRASLEVPAQDGGKRRELTDALVRAGGNVETAAQSLGVSRATFYRLCRRCGVVPRKVRRSGGAR